jgi:general secretion pathway protein A
MTSRPFGLRDEPFAEGHDRRLVYPHRTHRESVDRLALGIAERAPVVLLSGAAGAGKTTTLATLLASAGTVTRIDLVGSASLGVEELWRRLAESIESPNVARSGEALAARLAARDAEAPVLVLAIDDAHELTDALLEELRVLSTVEAGGRAAFTLVLAGRPALEKRIEQPEHEGLRSRIAARGRLEAMTPRETESFLHHRVSVCGGPGSVFPRPTCRAIHEHARGIARDVRVLAREALALAGAAGASAVETAHVNAAVEKLSHGAGSSPVKGPEPKVAEPQPVKAAEAKNAAPEPVEAKVESPKPVEPKDATPKAVEPKVEAPKPVEPKVETLNSVEPKTAPEKATPEKAEKPKAAPAKSTPAPKPATSTPKPATPTAKPPAPKPAPASAAAKAPATPAKAPASVAARSEAPAPISKLAPGPSVPAPKATPQPAPVLTPEEVTYVSPPVEHTPAIDAWLARFHDPAGVPRIGSRVAVDDSTTELAAPRLTESPIVDGPEGEALPPLPKLRPRRGRVVGRGPLRPSRYARRSSSIGWVVAATVIAAIGAVLWLHRTDVLAWLSSLARMGEHRRTAAVATPAPAPAETHVIAHETPAPEPEPAPPPRPMVARTAAKTSRVTVTPLLPGHAPAPPHAPASPELYEPARPESTPKETTTSDTTPQGSSDISAQTERHYRVIVGTYLVPDRAHEERDRVAGLTPFSCKVLRGHEDGAEVFRVLVGPFATRAEAEAASEQLSSTGSVNEARVVGWFGPKAPHD